MAQARRTPARSFNHKNSDLGDVMDTTDPLAADQNSINQTSDYQVTQLRLKMKKLKAKIAELKTQNDQKDEIIAKHKSKGSDEIEYSAKLRKDLLE